MPNDLIRYDLLVQEALCGVVSRVLADVARHGLPGDHHFYITFRTHAPGVRLSSRMREQYPDEMTIILQHQFEDLKVTDHGFEVGLSFKGLPEILLIPFDALTGFFDPSVQFSLKFEPQGEEEEGESGPQRGEAPRLESVKPQILPAPVSMLTQKAGLPAPLASAKSGSAKPALAGKPAASGKSPASDKPDRPAAKDGAGGNGATDAVAAKGAEVVEEAKVVSIDAFRKKP